MPDGTERVSGRCRPAGHPVPPSKQPPGQGAPYVSEGNVTSCAIQAFIAGYCEISLIKSVSEMRNYFEPGTDGYYNRKAKVLQHYKNKSLYQDRSCIVPIQQKKQGSLCVK